MRGPIDYIVVAFDGNNFKGEILRELDKATKDGTIAVLALKLVAKDADGAVTAVELDENSLKFSATVPLNNDLVTGDDVDEVGDLLEPNTAAGILVVEHLWAIGLKKAIIDAGGTLVVDGRIHPDAAEELDEKEGK